MNLQAAAGIGIFTVVLSFINHQKQLFPAALSAKPPKLRSPPYLLNYSKLMQNSISAFLKTFNQTQVKSLSEIQKQLRESRPPAVNTRLLSRMQEVNDLKILSPFYSRPLPCSNNHCPCPYHKKLRITQIPLIKKQNRPTHFPLATTSQSKKIKTGPKDVTVRLTHRSPLQRKPSIKPRKTFNWQPRAKVESHNLDFNSFLQQFQQIMLTKTKMSSLDRHKIKSSVGEIFQYIYTHLDVQEQIASQHISKMEKDRGFTDFYMQRFRELKARGTRKKQSKADERGLKQKTFISQPPATQYQPSSSQSKAKTKFERRQLSKQTNRSKHQRLMLQQMLDDIECGEKIQQDQIQKFAYLQPQNFKENCSFLAQKVTDKGENTLEEILNQVIKKVHKKLNLQKAGKANTEKILILENLIALLTAQIKQFHQQSGDQQRKSYRNGMSSRSVNTKNSNHQLRNKTRLSVPNKNNETLFAKSAFSQPKKQGVDSEIHHESEEGQTVLNQGLAQQIGERQSHLRISVEGGEQGLNVRAVKAGKLKLAQYRRLSHDPFYHKKMLNDEEEDFIFSKMKLTTFQDIQTKLDSLAFYFSQEKKRLRDIERRIKEFNLLKYMINDNDSLITAKRKIRVLKNLIKHEQFEYEVRLQISEYLKMMQQQNLVKNRKWAGKKIRNVLNLNDQAQQVEIFQGDQKQEDKYQFQQIIGDIFGKGARLLYYDLLKTTYSQKQVDFEQPLLETTKISIAHQKKQQQPRPLKKNTIALKKNTAANEVEQRESTLLQVALNNKCLSHYFLLTDGADQHRIQTRRMLQEQSCQLNEDRYLSLLNKLSRFGK